VNFDKVLQDREPPQCVKTFRRFRDRLYRHPKCQRTESVPETSEDLYTLTKLSAEENFIEFLRQESL